MVGYLCLVIGYNDPTPAEKRSGHEPQHREWVLSLLHSQTRGGTFFKVQPCTRTMSDGTTETVWRAEEEDDIYLIHGYRSQNNECLAHFPATWVLMIEEVIRSVRPRESAMYVTAVLQRLEIHRYLAQGAVMELCRRGVVPYSSRAMSRLRWCGEREVE